MEPPWFEYCDDCPSVAECSQEVACALNARRMNCQDCGKVMRDDGISGHTCTNRECPASPDYIDPRAVQYDQEGNLIPPPWIG